MVLFGFPDFVKNEIWKYFVNLKLELKLELGGLVRDSVSLFSLLSCCGVKPFAVTCLEGLIMRSETIVKLYRARYRAD